MYNTLYYYTPITTSLSTLFNNISLLFNQLNAKANVSSLIKSIKSKTNSLIALVDSNSLQSNSSKLSQAIIPISYNLTYQAFTAFANLWANNIVFNSLNYLNILLSNASFTSYQNQTVSNTTSSNNLINLSTTSFPNQTTSSTMPSISTTTPSNLSNVPSTTSFLNQTTTNTINMTLSQWGEWYPWVICVLYRRRVDPTTNITIITNDSVSCGLISLIKKIDLMIKIFLRVDFYLRLAN